MALSTDVEARRALLAGCVAEVPLEARRAAGAHAKSLALRAGYAAVARQSSVRARGSHSGGAHAHAHSGGGGGGGGGSRGRAVLAPFGESARLQPRSEADLEAQAAAHMAKSAAAAAETSISAGAAAPSSAWTWWARFGGWLGGGGGGGAGGGGAGAGAPWYGGSFDDFDSDDDVEHYGDSDEGETNL